MKTLQELKAQLESIKVKMTDLSNRMGNFELEESEYEDKYKDLIDELTGTIKIMGISFNASRILEELDPIAYNCGLSDYVDSLDKIEDSAYIEMQEEYDEFSGEVFDLEEEINNLEMEGK